MAQIVVLDTGPLGLLTSPPRKKGEVLTCAEWLATLLANRVRAVVPEIADYELRRELLRAKKARSVARLDELAAAVEYLPITTAMMRRAAELWAQIRQQGKPTAADSSIDADVILAAQAQMLGANAVVATTNVGHLSRLVPAELWQNI